MNLCDMEKQFWYISFLKLLTIGGICCCFGFSLFIFICLSNHTGALFFLFLGSLVAFFSYPYTKIVVAVRVNKNYIGIKNWPFGAAFKQFGWGDIKEIRQVERSIIYRPLNRYTQVDLSSNQYFLIAGFLSRGYEELLNEIKLRSQSGQE